MCWCQRQGAVRLSSEGFGSNVDPVNIDLVEAICEGFGCSEAIGTDMAGVVVEVDEDCDLMSGPEV